MWTFLYLNFFLFGFPGAVALGPYFLQPKINICYKKKILITKKQKKNVIIIRERNFFYL